MTETKMEVIKLMPKEYTQAEANAFKHGFFLGAKSERNELVQEAVKWLKENKDKYLYNTGEKGEYIPTCSSKMIDEFRKYMKGE